MRDHVRLLGALYVALGALGLLGAVVVLVVLGGVAGLVGALVPDEAEATLASMLLMAVGTGVFMILCLMSLPNVIAGVGLLRLRPWARVLGLVLSALNLLNLPLGTVLAVYGFWVLMSGETDALFDPGSRPAAG